MRGALRNSRVVTENKNGSNVVTSRTRVDYDYTSTGIRSLSIDWNDANLNNSFATSERTGSVEYLVDSVNHTSYAQTIVETTKNAAGVSTKRIVYTYGSDEISQTTYLPPSGGGAGWNAGTTLTFSHDAHTSVRMLTDAAGAIAQVFTYAAYGELIAIHNRIAQSVGTVGAQGLQSQAHTSLLYNGEAFDSRIGQLYLRARWYDGHRFTTLDPFFGNGSDPLSFNKYGFVHANPIHGIDPTGMFFSVGGLLAGIAISTSQQGQKGSADVGTLGFAGWTFRAFRVFQQMYSLYDRAVGLYEIYETISSFLDFDINDLNDIRAEVEHLNSYLSGGVGSGQTGSSLAAMGSGSLGSGGSSSAGVRAAFQSKLGIPKRKQGRVQQILDKAESMGLLNRAQEIIGEFVTSWAAEKLLGYQKTTLKTYHDKHPQGIDLLAKHTITGSWGVFESKGGSSGLGKAKYGPGGSEVQQMSGYWINHWLDDTIRQNPNHPDQPSLRTVRQSIIPMAAVVTRFNNERKSFQITVTAQLHFPMAPSWLDSWPRGT